MDVVNTKAIKVQIGDASVGESPPSEIKDDPITKIKPDKTNKKMNSEADDVRFLAELTEEKYRLTHGAKVQKIPVSPLAIVYREEKIDPGGLGGDFFIGNDKIEGSGSPTLTYHEFVKWRKAVIRVSYISIFIQLVLAVTSIVEGLHVDSAGTLGFGVETLLDIATSVVVVWHFHTVDEVFASKAKERITTTVLGIMMCLFSIGMMAKSIYNLVQKKIPFNEFKLLLITSVAAVVFTFLGWIKLYLSQKIGSKSVMMDAMCTFAATSMAVALMLSLTVYHFTNLWFLDGIVAIIIALVMMFYGISALWKNYSCMKGKKF
eukprot:TCONS_00003472-protein